MKSAASKRKRWTELKARLETFDRAGLLGLIADLYAANPANRRFFESRLLPESGAIEGYRQIVATAISPDPFSHRPVSVREANTAIAEYRRATGDVAGAVDLMLTFVEAGTEQAADLGYGDDAYFDALETKVNAVLKAFDELPPRAQATTVDRLRRVRNRAEGIGWGYGDYLNDVASQIERHAVQTKGQAAVQRLRGKVPRDNEH